MSSDEKNTTKGDVNGSTTPISNKPINPVASDEWQDCSLSDLQNQLLVLRKRYDISIGMGRSDMSAQIARGIAHLELTIQTKFGNTGKLV